MVLKKIFWFIIFAIPVLIVGIVVFIRYSTQFDFGKNTNLYQTSSYSDIYNEGNSKAQRVFIPNKILSFEYTLDSGYIYPYVGAGFSPKPPQRFFDLSDYDLIEIEIEASRGKRIPIQIVTFVDGFTKEEEHSTNRYLMYDIDLKSGQKIYNIPLSEFKTPTWWFNGNQTSVEKLPPISFDKITTINFHNCQLIPLRETDTVMIGKLIFKKDIWKHWAYFMIGTLMYYILLFPYLYVQRKKEKPITINTKISFQEKLNISKHADKDLEKIITYIGTHYHDSELSVPIVQKETGVSESKISNLLKSEFGTSFKQYLTEIRLNETKRLLLETDLQVSEIAYKVGFGNVSHFNRVFKTELNQSPTDFRSLNKTNT